MKTRAPNCASTRSCNREESTVLSLTASGGKVASVVVARHSLCVAQMEQR